MRFRHPFLVVVLGCWPRSGGLFHWRAHSLPEELEVLQAKLQGRRGLRAKSLMLLRNIGLAGRVDDHLCAPGDRLCARLTSAYAWTGRPSMRGQPRLSTGQALGSAARSAGNAGARPVQHKMGVRRRTPQCRVDHLNVLQRTPERDREVTLRCVRVAELLV